MNKEKIRIRFYFLKATASGTTWVDAEFKNQENFNFQWEQEMKKVNTQRGIIFLHTVVDGEIMGFNLSNIAWIETPAPTKKQSS